MTTARSGGAPLMDDHDDGGAPAIARLLRNYNPIRILHRVLLFDYNAGAAAYWIAVVAMGGYAFARALFECLRSTPTNLAPIMAGIVAAGLAGLFPLRKKDSKDGVAAGEIFVFLLLAAHGPAAATLAAAVEAACISWRLSRRWSSRIAGPAMAAIAMALCGGLFELVRGLPFSESARGGLLLTALTVVALGCFLVNAMLVSMLGMFKRLEPLSFKTALEHFGSLGLAYAASASVAGLVYVGFLQLGMSIIAALVPIAGIILATHRLYYRRQEAEAAIRIAQEDSARRELAQANEHLHALKASERRFESMFRDASVGMALLTVETGTIVQVNEALAQLLGCPKEQIPGCRLGDFIDPHDAMVLGRELAGLPAANRDSPSRELHWQGRDGVTRMATLHCSVLSEPIDGVRYLIVQLQDVTARFTAERRLRYIAFNDELTALPNRANFCDALAAEIALVDQDPRHAFAVMFLDLDRFKIINDSLGHSAGDAFLKTIGARLSSSVRPSDLVARFGGDEFAVLARGIRDKHEADELAQRMLASLRRPLGIHGNQVSSSASIGISLVNGNRRNVDEILRDVDIAMYRAKSQGSGRYVHFDAVQHNVATDQLHLEGELRRAIANGELLLEYQPIYSMSTDRLVAFEALVRWRHPQRGVISPGVFVPLAEESGLIAGLTDWVIGEACRQLSTWQKQYAAARPLTVHTNISGWDLHRPDFPGTVARILRTSGLQPGGLTLELTESTLMHRFENALSCLLEMERMGVQLSIDDFGTGYSSLSYLSQLPFDSFKIDRSFIAGLDRGPRDAEIVRTIVSLGKALGKSVVAEGIETAAQMETLRKLGCQCAQGFHLGRPMGAEAANLLLASVTVNGSRDTLRDPMPVTT